MEKITWANASESMEVVILKTTKGKKFYMLAKYKPEPNENNYSILSDATGKPIMWTRKEDMIEYAKKKRVYLVPGYHFIGGKTWGNYPPWL